MKFKFIGEEQSEFMGFKWYPGTEHDVTDPHAVNKLSNSILFEKLGEKPGRKAKQVSENGDDKNAD
ncbi:hypothetical protein [Hyphomicrobium sp. MC1]|uniref:hypothetical protein n=1 Tax=Hyphomicrobium sp. (strain MC1) TaxID=717785 RepID=UPI000213DAB3|nr:hypothetical protein [Hyphomicrobium sp. MC1]CCB64472.1 conserved protein of unknown function [Hyphomicrobium sp. MC1]